MLCNLHFRAPMLGVLPSPRGRPNDVDDHGGLDVVVKGSCVGGLSAPTVPVHVQWPHAKAGLPCEKSGESG
jgi:hypothetical protein